MSSAPRRRAERKAPAARASELAAAARALALGEGLSAVTLRAVASRAEVTPALVAHYVPSMDALVASTFSDIVGAELDELDAIIATGTPEDRLSALIGTLTDGTRDDVTLVWVEAFALGQRSDTLAAAVRTAMDRWQRALEALVADGVAAGAFHVESATEAAWQLLGMVDGLNAQSLVRWGGASDRSTLLERAVEGMLGLPKGALDRTRHLTSGRTP